MTQGLPLWDLVQPTLKRLPGRECQHHTQARPFYIQLAQQIQISGVKSSQMRRLPPKTTTRQLTTDTAQASSQLQSNLDYPNPFGQLEKSKGLDKQKVRVTEILPKLHLLNISMIISIDRTNHVFFFFLER